MSGIEGARGLCSWLEQSAANPGGTIRRARESVGSTLANGGFVDFCAGSLSTLRARIQMQLSLSDEADIDFGAASRLVTSLRSKTCLETDSIEQTLDQVEPGRVKALLQR